MSTFDAALRAIVREVVLEVLRDERSRSTTTSASTALLSIAEAAALARVTQKTIRRWIAAGRLRRYQAGARLRVLQSELEALLRYGGRPNEELTPEELAERDFG